MSKALPPEIKALRAMARALAQLDDAEQKRVVEWLFARYHGTTQDDVRKAMRLRKAMRRQGLLR